MDAKNPTSTDDDLPVESFFSLTDDDQPSADDDFGTSDLIPLIDDKDKDGTSGSSLKRVRSRIFRREHVRKNLMVSCPKLTGCTVM